MSKLRDVRNSGDQAYEIKDVMVGSTTTQRDSVTLAFVKPPKRYKNKGNVIKGLVT